MNRANEFVQLVINCLELSSIKENLVTLKQPFFIKWKKETIKSEIFGIDLLKKKTIKNKKFQKINF